jgi:predicted DNA-binding transcriptional regulator AlpA
MAVMETEPTGALLIDIRELSRLLGRSVPSLERDDARGALPRPLKLGRLKKWRLAEVLAWVEAGAPGRSAWEAAQKKRTG